MRFQKSLRTDLPCLFFCGLLLIMAGISVRAQTTSFSYQGRLNDAGAPASGSYEMQFKLFDALAAGTQQPQASPVTLTFAGAQAIQVTNGIFTVQLDFGDVAFPGADRFLEVSIKKPADGTYTTLAPRQQLTSTPYAIQSRSATAALNFTGNLAGDVTGTQEATVVSSVGGETASNVASASQIANAATSTNTAGAVVRRDASGGFAAGAITAGNVTLATGGALTFGDGTQQTTGLDPNNLVRRNVQSGSVLVTDSRLTVTGGTGGAALQVNSQAADNQNLNDIIVRFRSTAFNSTFLTDRFRVDQAGGLVAIGTLGVGIIPFSGQGTRLTWYPNKAAFRAGDLSFASPNGPQANWDDANTGFFSWAGGSNTKASGTASFAIGESSRATNTYAFAGGGLVFADGTGSVALGYRNSATGDYSVALGQHARTGCVSGDLNCTTPFSYSGSLVFADNSTTNNFDSITSNEFAVRATGGFRFRTASDLSTGCDITGGNLTCTGMINGALPSGSASYIQNTTTQQSANFNISGNGTIGGALTANNITASSANNVAFFGKSTSTIGTWLRLTNSSTGGHNWDIISTGSGNGEGSGNLLMGDGNNGGTVILGNPLQVPSCMGCTTVTSDRNLKTNFAPVSSRSILERLAAIPIQTWNYRSDPANLRHIGPMAQDFFAAFGVGGDAKHINLLDEGGVAFAAIQELYRANQAKDRQINELTKRVEEMEKLSAIPQNLALTGQFSKADPSGTSPGMMHTCNGNVTTGDDGEAIVTLPNHFRAQNKDFRYQLTVIGQFAQAIVLEKIKGNQFKIKTDKPRVEVSWQVAGIL